MSPSSLSSSPSAPSAAAPPLTSDWSGIELWPHLASPRRLPSPWPCQSARPARHQSSADASTQTSPAPRHPPASLTDGPTDLGGGPAPQVSVPVLHSSISYLAGSSQLSTLALFIFALAFKRGAHSMPVSLLSNNSVARLELHGGAASADVLLYGATVISWKAKGQERLFLSSKTPLDGSSAIRGGIPLVFPVFGSPKDHDHNQGLEKLPKHGVARTSGWKLKQSTQSDEAGSSGECSTKASFVLSSNDIPDLSSIYQWPFELEYQV